MALKPDPSAQLPTRGTRHATLIDRRDPTRRHHCTLVWNRTRTARTLALKLLDGTTIRVDSSVDFEDALGGVRRALDERDLLLACNRFRRDAVTTDELRSQPMACTAHSSMPGRSRLRTASSTQWRRRPPPPWRRQTTVSRSSASGCCGVEPSKSRAGSFGHPSGHWGSTKPRALRFATCGCAYSGGDCRTECQRATIRVGPTGRRVELRLSRHHYCQASEDNDARQHRGCYAPPQPEHLTAELNAPRVARAWR